MLEYQHRVNAMGLALDGDTYELQVRLTPRVLESIVGRLLGWDCPESRRPAGAYEIAAAGRALAIARQFLASPGAVWCRRELKRDSFGRELVTLWHDYPTDTGVITTDLGQLLADADLATPWPTRWRTVYA